MRTWGQLRYEIAKFAPGEDLQLVTQWLNASYREILDHYRWKGLEKSSILETTAIYQTGTATATAGSTAIVGVGTGWVTGQTGLNFRICGDNESYVFTFVDGTDGTLDRPYEGLTGTAPGGYYLFQNVYPLPSDVKYIQEILNPTLDRPLKVRTRTELDAISASRLVYGCPLVWAPGDDSPETDPPVLHSVELYPIPQFAVGMPFSYQQSVLEFDGTNTSAQPLYWISEDALVAGAKARVLAHQKNYEGSQVEAGRALEFRQQMTGIETKRTGPVRIQMARRFSKHRQRRWCR